MQDEQSQWSSPKGGWTLTLNDPIPNHHLIADIYTRYAERAGLQVRAIDVKHWSARLRRDTYRGYNRYILKREGRALLFGGDTAHTPLFISYRRHGLYDAAVMPIGTYDPYIHNHCTPEQSIAMADAAGTRRVRPSELLAHDGGQQLADL